MLLLVVEISLRVTAAAAAVALVLLAFRVRSGSVRHAAWSAVLVVMLTMPLLMAIVPEIEVPVPSTPALDFGTVAAPDLLQQGPVQPGRLSSPAGTPATAGHAVGPAPSRVSWTAVLITTYAAVAALLLIRLAAGWVVVRRMVRSAVATPLDRTHQVLSSAAVAAPLTTGIFRSVIVLPSDWTGWDEFKLRAVLAHEHAHIARRDALVSFIAQVNRAVFWFHPLAWWLERTIAVAAEHAADERAVREESEAGAYARVLLEFAEAVRLRGERVAWQALSVDGTGLLGVRIDRLVRGDAVARMSLVRRATTALACAVVLVIAIACRQQVVATPLREDPEIAKQLAEQKVRTERFQAAIHLSLAEIDALEARIEKDAEDWDAREQLVTYYSAGTTVPWDRKVPGLRKHALWLTQHHPEGRIAPPALSPEYDPQGFADAKRLWEKHLAHPNASPYLIYRAAQFFWPYDKPTTERLILRGQSIDPDAAVLKTRRPANTGGYEWHAQLADLYGAALLGTTAPWTRTYDATRAASPFAQEVRTTLETSRDARLLARVAAHIVDARVKEKRVPEMVELARRYMDRALELDPASRPALALKARLDSQERRDAVWSAVTSGKPVPDQDRLRYLAQKAQSHYMLVESFDRPAGPSVATGTSGDATTIADRRARAQENREAASRAANEALELAAKNSESADAPLAVIAGHHTLALLALRDGDRNAAVRHMLDSLTVRPLQNDHQPVMLWLKLTNYLLKEGERESVIQFFEEYAKIDPANQQRLLADAQAVREGRMPQSYQTMFARPEPR